MTLLALGYQVNHGNKAMLLNKNEATHDAEGLYDLPEGQCLQANANIALSCSLKDVNVKDATVSWQISLLFRHITRA